MMDDFEQFGSTTIHLVFDASLEKWEVFRSDAGHRSMPRRYDDREEAIKDFTARKNMMQALSDDAPRRNGHYFQ